MTWSPHLLCYSFKAPIVLSDGRVSTCTLDHFGENALANIYEHDFDTVMRRFEALRVETMENPLLRPMCQRCFSRLRRWKDHQVPRAGWLNADFTEEQKQRYLGLFDPHSVTINVELSSKCNLRCSGCALARTNFRDTRDATNIEMDRLLDWLGPGTQRINHVRLYHMGETWAHPRWSELPRFLKNENPRITLFTSTNGMPLATGSALEQLPTAGIDHIMFSIHGAQQDSTQKYMGEQFRLDVALQVAREVAAIRQRHDLNLHLSWKYILFEWNDTSAEIEKAMALADDITFDEIHFTITSQPAPSKRFTTSSEAWTGFRHLCARRWQRAADYQRVTPMCALHPCARNREPTDLSPPLPEDLRAIIDRPLPQPTVAPETQKVAESAPSPPCLRWRSWLKSRLPEPLIDRLRELRRIVANKVKPAPQAPVAVNNAARLTPEEKAECGRGFAQQGRPLEARALLNEALQRGVDQPLIHRALGDVLLDIGAVEEAEAAYRRGIDAASDTSTEFHWVGLGRALRYQERWADAAGAFQRAIQIRERNGGRAYGEDIYLELQEARKHLGDHAGARVAFQLWVEYSYLIERRSRVVYCPIPKNACTYLKTALVRNSSRAADFEASGQDAHVFTRQPTSGFHLRSTRFLGHPCYFSFIALRDPFRRLVSAYANLFVRPLRWHLIPEIATRHAVMDICRHRGVEPTLSRSASFEEFVHYLSRTGDVDLNYHWRPQAAFFDKISRFNHVGRVEDLNQTINVLESARDWTFDEDLDANRTNYDPLPAHQPYWRMTAQELLELPSFPRAERFYTEELRDVVCNRFQADIALYRDWFGIDAVRILTSEGLRPSLAAQPGGPLRKRLGQPAKR